MTTTHTALHRWVDHTARLTSASRVHWCDGSDEENRRLIDEMVADGTITVRDTTLLGGHVPELALTGRLDHEVFDGSVRGAFDGLDPGALSGRPALAGSVNGALDLRVALPDVTTPTELTGALK